VNPSPGSNQSEPIRPEPIRALHDGLAPMPYRLDLPPGPPPSGGHPFVLALHGKHETGDRLAARLGFEDPLPYARVFPSGPLTVEIGEGDARRRGHLWYEEFTGDQAALLDGLRRGEAVLMDFVGTVASRHGLDPSRAVMLGFSQGGYLGSFTALRNRGTFRGLVAISCRVKHEVLEAALAEAAGYPVLGLHGERDRGVRLAPQQQAFEVLRSHGLAAELHRHGGGHGFARRHRPLVDAFVRRVLGC
jgi:predicted esterase